MSSDMIELLVLFALAAVVLYRLKSVIGTRTGHEGPPRHLQRRRETVDAGPGPVAVPDPADEAGDDPGSGVPAESRAAIAAIHEIEPEFDIHTFIDGARGAYEMILIAYEEGDRETLRALLAPDVFTAFEAGINAREARGLRVEARFIGVREASLGDVAFEPDSRIADVTVRFVGELITSVHDAENRIVEGDPNEVRRQTDRWTFSREIGSVDPNWLLTGTGG